MTDSPKPPARPRFFAVPHAVIDACLASVHGGAWKVLLAIGRHFGSDGSGFPSEKTIGTLAGLKPRAVRNAVKLLVDLGLLAVTHHDGKPTTYQFGPAFKYRPQSGGPAVERTDPGISTTQEEETKKKSNARARFVPPSVEEVTAYCQERGNGIDPAHFVDYYATRGWKLKGGQSVKDWRAAVRTWERNGFSTGGAGNTTPAPEPIKYRN